MMEWLYSQQELRNPILKRKKYKYFDLLQVSIQNLINSKSIEEKDRFKTSLNNTSIDK